MNSRLRQNAFVFGKINAISEKSEAKPIKRKRKRVYANKDFKAWK